MRPSSDQERGAGKGLRRLLLPAPWGDHSMQARPLSEGTRASHSAEGDRTEAKTFTVFLREGRNDTELASLKLGSLNNFTGFWTLEPGSLVLTLV